ncbi:hypothetical protein L1887_58286 [Cichorium endivia]|nr:hypothetical protein L1887_58286 [Cichorium endivia]
MSHRVCRTRVRAALAKSSVRAAVSGLLTHRFRTHTVAARLASPTGIIPSLSRLNRLTHVAQPSCLSTTTNTIASAVSIRNHVASSYLRSRLLGRPGRCRPPHPHDLHREANGRPSRAQQGHALGRLCQGRQARQGPQNAPEGDRPGCQPVGLRLVVWRSHQLGGCRARREALQVARAAPEGNRTEAPILILQPDSHTAHSHLQSQASTHVRIQAVSIFARSQKVQR